MLGISESALFTRRGACAEKISRLTASFYPGLILCLFKVGTCEREGTLVRQCEKVEQSHTV